MLGRGAREGIRGPRPPARARPCPRPWHLHLPRILVPLALHAPQLRHALLQVGGSVAVLHLVVLAAVLGWGGQRRETPTSKSSRHPACGSEHRTRGRGPAGPAQNLVRPGLAGAEVGGQTHFDELHVQLGVLLHVLQQVSVECLHLCGGQGGAMRAALRFPRPRIPCTSHSGTLPLWS